MIFTPTKIPGVYVVDLERREDHRGFFARGFCAREFQAHGLTPAIAQINITFNHVKGTVRGLHFQVAPAEEAKFLRCVHGAVFDVTVDLRPDSPTYLQWFGVELTAESGRALYAPPMCAHGYQTLTDGAVVMYSASAFYTPECERGFRPDDPTFSIEWPLAISAISDKDKSWPLFGA
ncbi:MAG: dTDP-4-dehydrorhamnose 3,5-epimerase family protein [Anaerolineae bacterium]|nr:dTDP-4-dehydrorhamnose 3,5-epimerase family protein [Candidatus Roseilinea sp.]MDW8448434.1 dTDP-4-dehydrorhamnose 3,5-epimerase family protein [Anaerolineae bacterium]